MKTINRKKILFIARWNYVNYLYCVKANKKRASEKKRTLFFDTKGSAPNMLLTPLLLSLADVALITELSHLLCLSKELFGLIGISLLD